MLTKDSGDFLIWMDYYRRNPSTDDMLRSFFKKPEERQRPLTKEEQREAKRKMGAWLMENREALEEV